MIKLLLGCVSYLFAATASPLILSSSIKNPDNKVEFFAEGLNDSLRIEAINSSDKRNALNGELFFKGANLQGEATFELQAFDTGIALRNKHMNEKYLQTLKYPTAKWVLVNMPISVEIFKRKYLTLPKVPFQSQLTFHGVTLPVNGVAKVSRNNQDFDFEFNFTIDYSKFGVAIPTFMEVTLRPIVSVKATLKQMRFKKK